MKAKYDYDAKNAEELSFRKGDVLLIDYVVGNTTGWVRGQGDSGKGGLIPLSFVEKFSEDDKSADEEAELKAKEEEWKREQEAEKARELEREKERESRRQKLEAITNSAQGEVYVRALYDYRAQEEGELTFKKGDWIKLLEKDDEGGWWIGELRSVMGLFPKNFVEAVDPAKIRAKEEKKKPFGGIKLFPDLLTMPTATAVPVVQQAPSKGVEPTAEPPKETTQALYDYTATEATELSFKQGDTITILQKFENGWWRGEAGGQIGVFPVNFTQAGAS